MAGELIAKRMRAPSRRQFVLSTSVRLIDKITEGQPPRPGEVLKFISLHGGVASLSFIRWIADREPIEELQASTLRIGPKQYRYLDALARSGRMKKARFVTSTMQKELDTTRGPNYAREFRRIAERHGWEMCVANNHSKVILMKTASAWYVLETSSNLNENPKIEQYSFEDNRELYEFYSGFFDCLFRGDLSE